MSSATSPRVAYGEESITYFKPASMAQYPGTLQHGTYSEYRPEMAIFSKIVSVATGKYNYMESGLKHHSLGTDVSDVKSHSQQTETQKVKTVTEVASGSSKQSEQALDTTSNTDTMAVGTSGLKVIKLEYILKLKIKCNDWLLADTCPLAANHCASF